MIPQRIHIQHTIFLTSDLAFHDKHWVAARAGKRGVWDELYDVSIYRLASNFVFLSCFRSVLVFEWMMDGLSFILLLLYPVFGGRNGTTALWERGIMIGIWIWIFIQCFWILELDWIGFARARRRGAFYDVYDA